MIKDGLSDIIDEEGIFSRLRANMRNGKSLPFLRQKEGADFGVCLEICGLSISC